MTLCNAIASLWPEINACRRDRRPAIAAATFFSISRETGPNSNLPKLGLSLSSSFTVSLSSETRALGFKTKMAQRWESDLDEDLQDVDLNLAIGTYGQNGIYDDGALLL